MGMDAITSVYAGIPYDGYEFPTPDWVKEEYKKYCIENGYDRSADDEDDAQYFYRYDVLDRKYGLRVYYQGNDYDNVVGIGKSIANLYWGPEPFKPQKLLMDYMEIEESGEVYHALQELGFDVSKFGLYWISEIST